MKSENKMIFEIWIRWALLFLLSGIPIVIHILLQMESIDIAFSLFPEKPNEALSMQLQNIKKLSQLEPEQSTLYREQFEQIHLYIQSLNDVHQLQEPLKKSLLVKSLWIIFGVIIFSLLVSYFLAKRIVNNFKSILKQNTQAQKKLETLNTLTQWQNVARTLVHEIRTPLTPIQLVSSSLQTQLSPFLSPTTPSSEGSPKLSLKSHSPLDAIKQLKEGMDLIQENVLIIKKMMDHFSEFAKLPEAQLQWVPLHRWAEKFLQFAQGTYDNTIILLSPSSENVRENVMAKIDPMMLQQLAFNLFKNACEANPERSKEQPLIFEMCILRTDHSIQIVFWNSGVEMPLTMKKNLFKIGSTSNKAGNNFGLGLSICKKIAIDHGGDLFLKESPEAETKGGVTFILELPLDSNIGVSPEKSIQGDGS